MSLFGLPVMQDGLVASRVSRRDSPGARVQGCFEHAGVAYRRSANWPENRKTSGVMALTCVQQVHRAGGTPTVVTGGTSGARNLRLCTI